MLLDAGTANDVCRLASPVSRRLLVFLWISAFHGDIAQMREILLWVILTIIMGLGFWKVDQDHRAAVAQERIANFLANECNGK